MASCVFAADLGGTKLAGARIDENGKILARMTEPVDHGSPSGAVKQIERMAAALGPCVAAGVAVPGLVRRNGTVWAPNLNGWDRMPLARRLEKALGVHVVVDSDRNAAVVGEAWRGAARGKSDVVVVIIGTGIGAGILAGGSVLRGAHELAGCVGWMAGRGGPALELLAAGPGIAKQAQKAVANGGGRRSTLARLVRTKITGHDVAEAARRGDRLAKQVFAETGRLLGLAVADMISLFDPEVVVVGGGLAGSSDLYFDVLEETARRSAQPLSAKQVKIRVSRLGGDANLLGAARMAWTSRG